MKHIRRQAALSVALILSAEALIASALLYRALYGDINKGMLLATQVGIPTSLERR